MSTILPNPIRVLVVDDQEITRLGLICGLERRAGVEVIGEAENGEDAIRISLEKQPDVILMDIMMPVLNGILATQRIKQGLSECKVIMFTGCDDESEVTAAFSAGADAYCKKNIEIERLVQIMQMVLEGAIWIDPAIAGTVMGMLKGGQAAKAAAPVNLSKERVAYNPNLTERETEILELIVAGMSNKDIAQSLTLSVNTVKTHVRNIIQKLAVDDRTQAAVKGIQDKLCRPETMP